MKLFVIFFSSVFLLFSFSVQGEEIEQTLSESVHTGFECANCHPDISQTPMPEKLEKVVCANCHSEIGEEHAKGMHHVGKHKHIHYLTTCSECHGTHNILPKSDKKSPTHRANIPLTCKKCHLGVFGHFVQSAHGKLWEEGDERGPICTTCHKAHKIEKISSTGFRIHLPEECGKCHESRAPSYKDTFHGKATSMGYLVAAKCSDCHTAHLNLSKEDPDSTIHPDNLMGTCGGCHANINANFVQYDPHPDPHDKSKSALLYYVSKFMGLLLTFTFGFFGVHTLLWFQRTVVTLLRKEVKRDWKEDRYIVRFDREHVITHVLVVISFLGLVATGLPLKYHDAPWAKIVSLFFGGVEVSRYFHRFFATVTACYVLFHLSWLIYTFIFRRRYREVRMRESILPGIQDLIDLWRNILWFLYLGKRPKMGRWTYWEKFDYFAIFWGIPVMGISGLILWFPEFFTKYFPGVVINLAMVIHSEEALLALGFIFIFHFFHNHLRPENFPLDTTIFTGKLPLERFIEERPAEYEQLLKEGKLEGRVVPPPTRSQKMFARWFGSLALGTGLVLIVLIFIAFFSRL